MSRVFRDRNYNHVRMTDVSKVPVYNSLSQPGDEPGMEGNIVLSRNRGTFTGPLFYGHDGNTWVPFGGGGGALEGLAQTLSIGNTTSDGFFNNSELFVSNNDTIRMGETNTQIAGEDQIGNIASQKAGTVNIIGGLITNASQADTAGGNVNIRGGSVSGATPGSGGNVILVGGTSTFGNTGSIILSVSDGSIGTDNGEIELRTGAFQENALVVTSTAGIIDTERTEIKKGLAFDRIEYNNLTTTQSSLISEYGGADRSVTLVSGPINGTVQIFRKVDTAGTLTIIPGAGDTLEGVIGNLVIPNTEVVTVGLYYDDTDNTWHPLTCCGDLNSLFGDQDLFATLTVGNQSGAPGTNLRAGGGGTTDIVVDPADLIRGSDTAVGNGGVLQLRGGDTLNGAGGSVTMSGADSTGGNGGGAVTIASGSGGATSANGGVLTVRGGVGNGTANGGELRLFGGVGSSVSAGGNINMIAGDTGAGGTGNAGEINIRGGNTGLVATSGIGGAVTITGGQGFGGATPSSGSGIVTITGGSNLQPSNFGGRVTIETSDALPGTGAAGAGRVGDIRITGGIGGDTAGVGSGTVGGEIFLSSGKGGDGDNANAAGQGGAVNVSAGDSGASNTGSGSQGGAVNVTAGNSTGVGNVGGTVNITTGGCENGATSGSINLVIVGGNNGGPFAPSGGGSITGGAGIGGNAGAGSNAGNGGSVSFFSGQGGSSDGVNTSGNGGSVNLIAGDAGADAGNPALGNLGGVLTISSGDSTGDRNGAQLLIQSGNAGNTGGTNAIGGNVTVTSGDGGGNLGGAARSGHIEFTIGNNSSGDVCGEVVIRNNDANGACHLVADQNLIPFIVSPSPGQLVNDSSDMAGRIDFLADLDIVDVEFRVPYDSTPHVVLTVQHGDVSVGAAVVANLASVSPTGFSFGVVQVVGSPITGPISVIYHVIASTHHP